MLRDRVVRTMIGTSAAVTLCAATMNVGELVLAKEDLKVGATGFAMLVSVYGFGLVVGALCAGRDGGDPRVTYFAGLGGVALGMVGTAFAPGLGFALFTFALHRCRERPVQHEQPDPAARGRSRSRCTGARSGWSTRSTPGASGSR